MRVRRAFHDAAALRRYDLFDCSEFIDSQNDAASAAKTRTLIGVAGEAYNPQRQRDFKNRQPVRHRHARHEVRKVQP